MPKATETIIDPEKDTKNRINIIKENLTELRRSFDHICNIYDQLRTKALAFVAGEIALVTFLFSSDIEFPDILYGQILFISAVLAMIVSFGLSLWTISTVAWKIPSDFDSSASLKAKYPTEIKMLEYMNDDYVAVVTYCNNLVSRRAKRFNWTIYLLSFGAIIILLIKYGGPA